MTYSMNGWTDEFGDTLKVEETGSKVLVTIITGCEGCDPCVSLDFAQQRSLRDVLDAHLRRCGQ